MQNNWGQLFYNTRCAQVSRPRTGPTAGLPAVENALPLRGDLRSTSRRGRETCAERCRKCREQNSVEQLSSIVSGAGRNGAQKQLGTIVLQYALCAGLPTSHWTDRRSPGSRKRPATAGRPTVDFTARSGDLRRALQEVPRAKQCRTIVLNCFGSRAKRCAKTIGDNCSTIRAVRRSPDLALDRPQVSRQ